MSNETVKSPSKSKTIWAGVAAMVLPFLAMLAEFWSLLSWEQMELLDGFFGPELVALIGAIMIALRVYTSSALYWGTDEGEVDAE